MGNFTFKGMLLATVFMLLGCLSIQAGDDGLITKQITVTLDKAGTLQNKIGSAKKYKITNLKIVGEINGTDWRMIRDMAGRSVHHEETEGKMTELDLSDASIVSGGDYYITCAYFNYPSKIYTSNQTIGDLAFEGCSGLTSLKLPSNILYIERRAFAGCSGLTSIILPSGLHEISEGTFSGCSGLTNLTLPSGVTEIDQDAFSGCSGLTNLTLPSGLTKIGVSAFSGCSGLTSITLPSDVDWIESSAFSGCSGLTSITLPSDIAWIGNLTFSGCSGLTSITLPSGIARIGNLTFKDCSGLTSIYVCTEKLPDMGRDVFDGCDAKKCTVYVPKGTYDDYWISEFGYFENIVEFDPTGINNVITSNDTKELSRYSLNGQRLSAPTKGLNIVKYSDGSVKKVAVQ